MTEDDRLRRVLKETRVIACVGVSANPVRPSNYVARYLKLKGFRVIPVNPGLEGQSLFGERVAASLSEIDANVDMVDIFRRSEVVPPLVTEAIAHLPGLKTIWMQIGVVSEEGAEIASTNGLEVVMDRCTKMEYQRLFGELRHAGAATGLISSRL